YRSANGTDQVNGKILSEGVYKKTNFWAQLLESDEFEIVEDSHWQISGNYKRYSWARIFRKGQKDKKIYFTVGVHPAEQELVIKLDCQWSQKNPNNALSNSQYKAFQDLIRQKGIDWKRIHSDMLHEYDWNRLVN